MNVCVCGLVCMRRKTKYIRIQIVSEPSDVHSKTVGGGNAPISWMPTAVKQEEDEESIVHAVGQCFPTFFVLCTP